MTDGAAAVRFGVIGADHLHLFQMVDRLVAAGATAVAHAPEGGLAGMYAGWRTESVERPADEILADDSIGLIVSPAYRRTGRRLPSPRCERASRC